MSIIDIHKLSKDQQSDIQQFYNKIRSYDIDKNIIDEIFSEIVGFDCMNIKTWDDLVEHNLEECLECSTVSDMTHAFPCEKSAQAFLKIYYLIEHAYGGFPKYSYNSCTMVFWDIDRDEPALDRYYECNQKVSPIVFKFYEDAEEFIKHKENVELLKTFFMINVEEDYYD